MKFTLSLIYLIVTCAVIFSMAALFSSGEKTKANKMYLGCHFCVALWCASQLMLFTSESSLQFSISYLAGNLGICFSGAFWLSFGKNYRKQSNNNLINLISIIAFVYSALHYIIIITNPIHHLYYSKFEFIESNINTLAPVNVIHGIFFYSNVIGTYLMIFLGGILLNQNVKRSIKGDEKKSGPVLILLAVFIPIIFNIINLTNLTNTDFDITPLGFAISVILVRIATLRYNFFDLKKELNITTEKLILEKERNRIAQRVHDTTGHTLTMLQSYMKLTEVAVKDGDKDEALSNLSEARILTGQGIKELRESIKELKSSESNELVTNRIKNLAESVKEIPCTLTIQGEDSEKYNHLSSIIFDNVRECITNTLKYADASKIDIVIRFKENVIELIVADDGKGCEQIKDNNGLNGIKERVNSINGKVRFLTAKNEGFMTRMELPIS